MKSFSNYVLLAIICLNATNFFYSCGNKENTLIIDNKVIKLEPKKAINLDIVKFVLEREIEIDSLTISQKGLDRFDENLPFLTIRADKSGESEIQLRLTTKESDTIYIANISVITQYKRKRKISKPKKKKLNLKDSNSIEKIDPKILEEIDSLVKNSLSKKEIGNLKETDTTLQKD